MTERLDRIEAMLLAMTERQNETTATLAQTNATLAQTSATLDQTNDTLAQTNATLDQTNTTIDRLAERQVRQADEIDTLLGAVSTNEVGIRELVAQISDSNQRFEVLRQEAIADRQRSDQRFEAMQENLQRLFLELHGTNQRVGDLEQAS